MLFDYSRALQTKNTSHHAGYRLFSMPRAFRLKSVYTLIGALAPTFWLELQDTERLPAKHNFLHDDAEGIHVSGLGAFPAKVGVSQ